MNPHRFKIVIFVGAIAIASLVATVLGRQIKVDVDLVNVISTVQDASGKYVTGLDDTDFHVYEDGVEQKVAVFEKQDVDSAVGILVDSSLSMVDILPMMKTGLTDFARHTSSFNELFVMSFGTRVRIIHDFSEPISTLESNLKLIGPQGTSVLFDALVASLHKIGDRKANRKALLIFTDGIDTASKAGFRNVLIAAQKAGALLYFIPIGARVLIDEHTVEQLAKETGGRALYLRKSDPIRPAMDGIRQELAQQYYLGYYAARRPGFHSIRVEIPGRDLKIRAKTGYYIE
jgi:Ca-activated chloride channel family protein